MKLLLFVSSSLLPYSILLLLQSYTLIKVTTSFTFHPNHCHLSNVHGNSIHPIIKTSSNHNFVCLHRQRHDVNNVDIDNNVNINVDTPTQTDSTTQTTTSTTRSQFLHHSMNIALSLSTMTMTMTTPQPSFADDTPRQPYIRTINNSKYKFSYTITLPSSFSNIDPTQKPLPTHLDEINFSSPTTSKYQYGITVDPIRLSSLRQFGTPNEVAAKIILAELNRDGVMDVQLVKDAYEEELSGGYVVEYISSGKRGKKRFVTKTIVKDEKLYVLTVQIMEEDYNNSSNSNNDSGGGSFKKEIQDAVDSFQVL